MKNHNIYIYIYIYLYILNKVEEKKITKEELILLLGFKIIIFIVATKSRIGR